MTHPSIIKKDITIQAPASKVWSMFVDPAFTRQMGGEYVSDWQVGSSLGWKGLNGQQLTNGVILKIETEVILQHSLFHSGTNSVMATITYELREHGEATTVNIQEEFSQPISEDELTASEEGWTAALNMVKELIEKK